MQRIRSDFWVSAQLRRCAGAGIDAVLRRRGAAEAGAIFVTVDRLDGTTDLYGPAPQSAVPADELGRVFTLVADGQPSVEVAARMAREVRFDPDLWWMGIDDRGGRHFLDLVPGANGSETRN